MDEAARADVEADVADAVEEDEVAGPERAARDLPAEAVVRVRAVWQVDAEVAEDVADEAGAVEAAAAASRRRSGTARRAAAARTSKDATNEVRGSGGYVLL